LPRRLEQSAPADPLRTGGERLNSGMRPGTSGQGQPVAPVFTDRGGAYTR
jgi:hypothetical protein